MEIVLGTQIKFNGTLIGSNPKSINFVQGTTFDVTVDSDNNFTVTIGQGSTTWFVSGTPSDATGLNGDLAFDNSASPYPFYVKTGGSWVKVAN